MYYVIFVQIDPSADLNDHNVIEPQLMEGIYFESIDAAQDFLSADEICVVEQDLLDQGEDPEKYSIEYSRNETGTRATIDVLGQGRLLARNEYSVVKIDA